LATVTVPQASPAVADLDHDGVPELIVAGDGEIAVLRADGSAFSGTPIAIGVASKTSPVVADLDGDGAYEILLGTSDFRMHAYQLDGTDLPGWPRTFTEIARAAPSVADVDGDGDLDVVLGADDAWIRVVDVAGSDVPGATPWPGFHGGSRMDGVYRHRPYVATGQPVPEHGPALPVLGLTLDPAAPSPFRDRTRLRFTLDRPTTVRLDVLDVSGRRVARLLEGQELPQGDHVVLWDGRDRSGLAVATGVYFVRLEAGQEIRHRKLVRLR
jgi:hypothetical protein